MWRLIVQHRRKSRNYTLSSFQAALQVIIELEGYDNAELDGKLHFDILDPCAVADSPIEFGHVAHTGETTKTRYVIKNLPQ
jgi:hypothetical protein